MRVCRYPGRSRRVGRRKLDNKTEGTETWLSLEENLELAVDQAQERLSSPHATIITGAVAVFERVVRAMRR
jgi:hypothetical protein